MGCGWMDEGSQGMQDRSLTKQMKGWVGVKNVVRL
jgi:hypothetical protein